jgi:DNA helicase HerA-like ATPase
VFGRYCIALVRQAALAREGLPERERRLAFLIIDEASEYFDESIEELLKQARKYGVSVLLANQTLKDMPSTLLDSVMTNTTLKLAGGVSDKSVDMLASDMRTRAEFIHAQTKSGSGTRFAAFVKNVTPTAVSLSVPFGVLDRAPQMSARELAAVLERNRMALSTPAEEPREQNKPERVRAPEEPNRRKPQRDPDDKDSSWGSY